MEERFYFDNGAVLNAVCAGNAIHNLRLVQSAFHVAATTHSGCVKIAGDSADVPRAVRFLKEASTFYEKHDCRMDQQDFELLLRCCRSERIHDIHELWDERITVSPKKRQVLPRSRHQLEYIRAIRQHDIVFGIGPAGTGKTYLAMALAVSSFLQGECSRIILTRPARESGENLGFLPGDLKDKVMPYLRPLYDALYDMLSLEEASVLIEKGAIEVAPLAFMRGRTLGNAFIILDEAQNTTPEQMLMFLTRIGFRSKCVVTGDPTQTDLPRSEESGLRQAERTLASMDEIAFCRFDTGDVVRHALLGKIIDAFVQGNHV